jgi:Raf kinase inhibitor-like YbhB/YbcL family protein
MNITCPVFYTNDVIPARYTCDGDNINPQLLIRDIPREAKSMALIFEDPNMQSGVFIHWIMWNIPPNGEISEDSCPGIQGLNGYGEFKYAGPCNAQESHQFHFKIYALDQMINLPRSANKRELLMAMEGHLLARGELVCAYSA